MIPKKSRIRQAIVPLLILPLALACDRVEEDWGDEELRGRIAALQPDRVTEATIALDECPQNPRPLEQETLAELLRQVSRLTPASDIGMREDWKEWRIITLRTEAAEVFEIYVATRDSLGGSPVVVLEDDPLSGIGFYLGDDFWEWLRSTRESAALETQKEGVAPCG